MTGKGRPSIVTVYPGDLIPYLAVGLWAGVRPEESIRMGWQDIDFERKHIDLPAKITKDHKDDNPIEPILIEWLMLYRPASGQGKIVITTNGNFERSLKRPTSVLGLRIVCATATDRTTWQKFSIRPDRGIYGHSNPDTFLTSITAM